MNRFPVAITGIGVISPIGLGYDAFAEAITLGVSGLRAWRDDDPVLVADVEPYELNDHLVAEKTYLDRCSELALIAAKLCLDDAGLSELPTDAARRGLVLGTAFGAHGTMEAVRDRVRKRGVRFATPVLFSHAFANTPASLLAMDFGLQGYHATITSGGASGTIAVQTAMQALWLGHADAVLAGGCEALAPGLIDALRPELARLSPGDDPDAYDPTVPRAGRALGEGAALLLLEPYAAAEARGARVRALLSSEADPTAPALVPDDGVHAPLPHPGPAAALKGLLGDALGASGALATAAAVAGVDHRVLPPVQRGHGALAVRREPLPLEPGQPISVLEASAPRRWVSLTVAQAV